MHYKQLNKDLSILIQQFGSKINIISIYVNDFLLTSNTITILDIIKASFLRKYNVKKLGEI